MGFLIHNLSDNCSFLVSSFCYRLIFNVKKWYCILIFVDLLTFCFSTIRLAFVVSSFILLLENANPLKLIVVLVSAEVFRSTLKRKNSYIYCHKMVKYVILELVIHLGSTDLNWQFSQFTHKSHTKVYTRLSSSHTPAAVFHLFCHFLPPPFIPLQFDISIC